MSGQLLLRGGRVIAADGEYDGDVLIDGEKIAAVGAVEANGATVVDVSGCLVMPASSTTTRTCRCRSWGRCPPTITTPARARRRPAA